MFSENMTVSDGLLTIIIDFFEHIGSLLMRKKILKI